MAGGKMVSLLTLLLSLIDLALAQTQTQTQIQTIVSRPTGTMDTVSMSTASTGVVTIPAGTITTTAYREKVTTVWVTGAASSNATTSSGHATTRTGLPTTTIPRPLILNAGRRPSQPGLGKLSLVVGLATYGLILM
ncbi:hypothetical protein NOR_00982 [Metarhizium rileyi]|uniref:Uncharacterized protein n=1 Tax=Metarhizium rileyi (strain RCEF 4871) TaxID=1649241 RepID=A0A167JNI9_METRR|nr:hypothetical protein NOR_00982 [Metarhizium rileyi RCEF 4871]